MLHQPAKRVLILGGGFAGLAAARALPPAHRVTLIDRRSNFEFLPNIHELVSGVKTAKALRLPYRETLHRLGHRFLEDDVTGIDPSAREVVTASGTHHFYDAAIVALGGVDATYGVPGVAKNAVSFKSVAECETIGRRLRELEGGGRPYHVVVVGGGFEGIEALGEILRAYGRSPRLSVTLVEGADRLMANGPPEVDARLRQLAAGYPVRFLCRAPVKRILKRRVRLAGGDTLESNLTIWTGGVAPPPLLADRRLTGDPGEWLAACSTLQHPKFPTLFVVGDVAGLTGGAAGKQAYHALDMGVCAARNIERLFRLRRLKDYSPVNKPALVSFGNLGGVLVWGDRAAEGVVFTLMKEAVFHLVMARLDRPVTWSPAGRLASRLGATVTKIGWPTLKSWGALRRLPGVRILRD